MNLTSLPSFQIPRPQLSVLKNRTPFRVVQGQKMAKGRTYYDVVVIKGTFDLAPGALELSEQQLPVALSDAYHDEQDASRSSIALPGDLIVGKPTTDVILTGHARVAARRPATKWECGLSVQRDGVSLLRSTAIATGPRQWRHQFGGFRLSDPIPTLEVPIRYELAYGGWYATRNAAANKPPFFVYKTNPSGSGVFDEATLDKARTFSGPQWELAGAPVTSINKDRPLAGFGPVARMWAARLAFAGTYDDAWMARMREDVAQGIPADYPADFDARFFQCAHPSLIAPTQLRPGDLVRLTGFESSGDLAFELPRLRPCAEILREAKRWTEEPLAVDLVHIDLDAQRVHVSWRMSLAVDRGIVGALLTMDEG